MAHFAQIENGIVTHVLVAEQEYVNTLPGTWVQTSYNTYGGVHYGPNGLPDGGVALRKNYAGIGFTYDPVRDAFISPRPSNLYELDEETCLWNLKPEFANMRYVADVVLGEVTIETALADGMKVLYPTATAPGVYVAMGGFLAQLGEEEYKQFNVNGDPNEVWSYDGTQWVSQVVTD